MLKSVPLHIVFDRIQGGGLHTKEKRHRENLSTNATKHDVASIVNTVHLRVAQFEAPNDIVRLGRMNE